MRPSSGFGAKLVLNLFLWYHIHLVLGDAVSASNGYEPEPSEDGDEADITTVCDSVREFYCKSEKKCVSRLKVCNFINDCMDAEDELACGSCNFGTQSAGQCGLKFTTDHLGLEWRLSNDSPHISASISPSGSVELAPGQLLRQATELTASGTVGNSRLLADVHKARVLFPPLRPTDSHECELSFWARTQPDWRAPIRNNSHDLPRVSAIAIEPTAGAHSSRRTLSLLDQSSHGNWSDWVQVSVQLGQRLEARWSLALLVETKYESDRLLLSHFEFTNCRPRDLVSLEQRYALESDQVASGSLAGGADCANEGQFKCELSGECIGLDYWCDFGRDCGPLDDSDEFNCPASFEGRCDFEQADKCNWFAPLDSWLWTGPRGPQLRQPRPALDHTHQYGLLAGHYLLLNTSHLDTLPMAQLIGPRVQLKAAASECDFRFWLQVSASLVAPESRAALEWAYMRVGYGRIGAGELVDASSREQRHEESEWRRFQVRLLARSPRHHRAAGGAGALHLAFGNLSAPGQELLGPNRPGYLALDDFSFSQGCQLVYYNQEVKSICSNEQFQCAEPAPATPHALCIPRSRVCDFKPDCGRDPTTGASSDEHLCPSECQLSRSTLVQCGLSLWPDGGRQPASLARPALFELATQELGQTQRALVLRSLATGYSNTSGSALVSQLRFASFNRAHGNCSFELEFEWSADWSNLHAHLYLARPMSLRRQFYGRLPADQLATRRKLSFGLGQQDGQFQLQLELGLERPRRAFAGSLSLFGYKFARCAYEPGVLDTSQQPAVFQPDEPADDDELFYDGAADDDDGDDDDAGARLQAAGRQPDLACASGQLQCGRPVLCVAEALVCDMQRDCQESGADEANCTSRGSIQFDFERKSQLANWRQERAPPSNNASWLIRGVNSLARRASNTGAPIDHTRRSDRGKFLALVPTLDSPKPSATQLIQGLIYLPQVRTGPACKRLVFYLYNSHGGGAALDANESTRLVFEVYAGRAQAETQLLYRLERHQQADRWQREELELPRSGGELTISLLAALDHQPGRVSTLAVDDLSLGPSCEFASNQERRVPLDPDLLARSRWPADEQQERARGLYMGRPYVVMLIVASLVVAVGALMRRRRQRLLARLASQADERDDGQDLALMKLPSVM